MNNNTDTPRGSGVHVRRAIAYVVLVILTFLCLFWFVILFVNATRSHSDLTRGFTLIPSVYLPQNWSGLIHGTLPVLNGLLNSVVVADDFKLKNVIFTFILAIMMIPAQVTSLGFLQLIQNMKLEDNLIPLILPAIAAPVTFFYMKQYMDSTLSLSLVEAARIDGAGEFKIFNSIVLPLMKPAIAVQAIFTFVSSWNNYFIPALILHKDKMKTLPVLIAQLRSADFLKFDMGQVYMMIAFSIFPVIVVYLILSRYIVAGVQLGGVKE